MSGPYCKECRWFYQPPLMRDAIGECTDPTKIIFVGGNPFNNSRLTTERGECRNWEPKTEAKEDGDE